MSASFVFPLAFLFGGGAGYLLNRLALFYLWRYTGEKNSYGGVVGRLLFRNKNHSFFAVDMVILEAAAMLLSPVAFFRWSGIELLFCLAIIYLILLLSLIDGRIRILPNQLNIAGVILGMGYAFFREDFTPVDALAGIAVGGGFALLSALVYHALRSREGLGLGDVKMLAFLGSFAGWEGVLLIVAGGSLIGAMWGVYTGSKKGDPLHHEIPFGPFLGLSALGYLFIFI